MNLSETYPKYQTDLRMLPSRERYSLSFSNTVTKQICTFVDFCKISWKKLTNFEEIQ